MWCLLLATLFSWGASNVSMVCDLSNYSVEEVRERFIKHGQAASVHLLVKMQRDPRRSVRQLCEILKKKKAKRKKEQQRINGMLNFERLLWKSGVQHVAGVDEVGVGPLAGPVVASAVVFPAHTEFSGVDDSKRLDATTRKRVGKQIHSKAASVGVGLASVPEIDQLNIYQAGILAMRRAIQNLLVCPDHVLIDSREIPGLEIPQSSFDKGDGMNFSIAAASIVAKLHRDDLMKELACQYPEYGFAQHKGYGTPEHQRAIQKYGPSAVHRKSFLFIQELCGQYSATFYALRTRLSQAGSGEDIGRFEQELRASRRGLPKNEYRKLSLLLTRVWRRLERGRFSSSELKNERSLRN